MEALLAVVPLNQVAEIKMKWEAGKIRHYDRRRTITIKSYIDGSRTANSILNEIDQKLKEQIEFSPGYGYAFGGEREQSQKAQGAIIKALPIGAALLVMVLVLQFGNVRKMLIILTTIPLSFIGVVLGLFLVNYPLSFFGMLGILSLAGIVVNNAILLIEQIDADIESGMPPVEALVHAGLRRANPIVLTTITNGESL